LREDERKLANARWYRASRRCERWKSAPSLEKVACRPERQREVWVQITDSLKDNVMRASVEFNRNSVRRGNWRDIACDSRQFTYQNSADPIDRVNLTQWTNLLRTSKLSPVRILLELRSTEGLLGGINNKFAMNLTL
jgi:hypothetical protein